MRNKIGRLAVGLLFSGVCFGCEDEAPTSAPPVKDEPQSIVPLDKVDLLFVVDNSISMLEKQEVLASSIRKVVTDLVRPPCLDESGHPVEDQPADAQGACPEGSARAALPVEDLHIGVISSSLYGCDPSSLFAGDDRAHLLSTTADGTIVPTYQSLGFLVWDPQQALSPPGEASLDALIDGAVTLVAGMGETGCGYEMPLEATARFLADPAPFAALVIDPSTGLGAPDGVDDVLLAQRAAFLRDDSIVSIVVLSDENDCSTDPTLAGYLFGNSSSQWRGTAACAADPSSSCCVSCGMEPPAGCSAAELACDEPMISTPENSPNLRCFDQKRRFGYDFHLPVARYQNALGAERIDPTAIDWAAPPGGGVDNPLFAGPRQPAHVVFTTISGVPWQDVAVDPADPTSAVKTSAEMEQDGTWALLVPEGSAPPGDPFMIESRAPRSGQNPATGAPVAAANAINGGDRPGTLQDDLQYTCTFELEQPEPDGVDCAMCADGLCESPICDGTTQIGGKAYPGTRQLELARALGEQGVVGSICPPVAGGTPIVGATRALFSYDRPLEQMTSRVFALMPRE